SSRRRRLRHENELAERGLGAPGAVSADHEIAGERWGFAPPPVPPSLFLRPRSIISPSCLPERRSVRTMSANEAIGASVDPRQGLLLGGRYRLCARCGAGSMGVVYEGVHE